MKTRRRHTKAVLLGVALLGLMMAPALAQQKNPERNVHYGETHVHTSWSLDAFAFGDTFAGPETFYQYSLGKPVNHPGGYRG